MFGSAHRPRKRFGQNFLHDPAVIDRIIRTIDPRPGERLVEIGPGLGALTLPLLSAVGRLDAVEIDRDVIPHLQEACAGYGELCIHNLDVLKCDFAALAAGQTLRLVGNLPYNISTPLIFHLLKQLPVVHDMHFMLQKEVAERLAAAPATEHYGRLGIMVQVHCAVESLFTVGPGAFKPAPKVDSAVVRLTPHRRMPVQINDESRFAALVTRAFSRRRKTLRNALKGLLTAQDIEALGIDPNLRPETLSLADYAALSNAYPDGSTADKQS
jgi:16S rRNA (adenine1518-N6/adenine1519-N6)-dimethyltransferase